MGWAGIGDAFRGKGRWVEDNTLKSAADRDWGVLLITCVYQPGRNMGNTHGAESRKEKSET